MLESVAAAAGDYVISICVYKELLRTTDALNRLNGVLGNIKNYLNNNIILVFLRKIKEHIGLSEKKSHDRR